MLNVPFFITYTAIFLVTWWLYFGYLIFIFLRSTVGNETKDTSPDKNNKQTITVLVPCRNEEALIEQKIKNTLSLNYPAEKLEIVFIDGGSTDKTTSIIEKYARKHKNIKLIKTQKTGKINQLNEVLPTINSDLIVCTDVDSELDKNTLTVINSELSKENVGLVGIKVVPKTPLPEETYFWEQQNRLRMAESRYYSPLYIIAGCYAFKRGLIEQWPQDCIADDIHISFASIKKGLKTVYTDKSACVELRNPTTLKNLLIHKTRKTNAFLIEMFRFFRDFFHSPIPWKIIFYTRSAQMLIGPFFLLLLVAIFIYVSLTTKTGILPFLTVLTLVFTYLLIRPAALSGFFKKIKTFFLILAVIMYCVITYPFYKQTSNYKRTE